VKDPFEEATEEVTPRRAAVGALLVALATVLLVALRPSFLDTLAIIVGIVGMVMFHEAGHYFAAKWSGMKVTEYFLGFGPRLWSFRRGETEYGVKAIPAGGYVRIVGMSNLEEVDPADEPRTYRRGTFGRRMTVVLAGVTANILLALVLLFVAFAGRGAYDGPSTTISSVVPDTPAARAGLESGDRIVSVGGREVDAWEDVPAVIEGRAGEPTTFVIERDGSERVLEITPVRRAPADGRGFVGVSPGRDYRSLGVVGAARESFETLGRGTVGVADGLVELFSPAGLGRYSENFTDEPPRAGTPQAEERPRSIIGIVDVGDDLVDGDVWTLLELLAVISLVLALFNLIPLLPFDGGHAAVAVYEQVASKVAGHEVRVDFRRLIPVTAVVLAVFVTLGLSAAFLDLREIFAG
jgi:membrane-associated protease RseP (regulator of RpoE activity)